MIFSMTGFGSGVAEGDQGQITVSLRSVNSRFFDLQIRSPGRLQPCENAVREYLQAKLSRGKVTAHIEWEQAGEDGALPVLDTAVAERYLEGLRQLRQLGLEAEPDLRTLATMPGVFRTESPGPDLDAAGQILMEAVQAALTDFEQMRRTEGESLLADLLGRLEALEGLIDRVESLSAADRADLPRRLREKVDALLRPGEIDEERLALEIVLVAERSDITEEFVRFRSHNAQFRAALEQGGEVGRRLNFLLQEMNREANTITSKATDPQVVHLAVEIKEEVERLREQIQNLA